jgi:hypothetical protein
MSLFPPAFSMNRVLLRVVLSDSERFEFPGKEQIAKSC